MDHKNNCGVCGGDLVYPGKTERIACFYCREAFEASARCVKGHYVCDRCHSLKGNDLIQEFCEKTDMTDPLAMARILMSHPHIKMHGPEHHFLVPAALIAAWRNASPGAGDGRESLKKARQRAENVLGGFCGFYGDCGAAVGTGIAVSVLTGATPLSREEWRLANLMTAKSLLTIAHHGGPRCCKRNSFLAIREAVGFMREYLGKNIPGEEDLKCGYTHLNKECLKEECPFFEGPGSRRQEKS